MFDSWIWESPILSVKKENREIDSKRVIKKSLRLRGFITCGLNATVQSYYCHDVNEREMGTFIEF